ncbi:DUF3046 domain-containing protein [Glutamicibacter bergerei]|uniref:DUF3046 domain-containing protein n=1 Tax=Glutamicibacter ardleyensis TaxID=225894 RepID=A0ABQ2DGY8_9MICC|nr:MULTISPECIES: DUF3046 domain-containing protein [Glutamicibacter]GGJ57321.1 hypothetical protein GCM10007173_15230 [Glutamicibacter ardleyensis]HAY44176.1 DUF3046 domain-containing protein [Micrococcaceae bacterium]HJX78406.1 DUF3046 domain-containing protein [Glutamicibacter sp.]
MKNSEFWRNMDHEFGSIYSRTLADSLALTELQSMNATEALGKGIKPREVWEAICRAQDLPPERWLGMDLEIKEP